jgi:membrane fusion protein (multidrug efflux system)
MWKLPATCERAPTYPEFGELGLSVTLPTVAGVKVSKSVADRMSSTRIISMFVAAVLGTAAQAAHAQSRAEAFTEPFHTVELSPAEPGILAKLFVKEGDAVQAGEAVAALDARVLEVSLKIARQAMQSKGRLRAARAEYDLKAQRLEKLKALKTQGYAFQDELERAAADVEVADANRLAAEEQLAVDSLQCEKAQAEVELRTLRSPIDGVVAKVHYEEREFVSAPNSAVLTVVQLNPLRIVFPLPTAAAVKLGKDQPVTVRLPETEEDAVGRVELVSPITDAESGMVRVRVLVPNAEGRYRAGVRAMLIPTPNSPLAGASHPAP